MTSRLIIALLACLFLNQVPAQAQDIKSARDFVQRVYRNYADPDMDHQEQKQATFYTPGLYHLILADERGHPGYVGKLDSDPICDCQDPGDPGELKVQSITFVASGQAKLKARVAFIIATQPCTVTLSLLDTRAGWRIDDIASKDMPSLRTLLGGHKTPKSQHSR